MARIALAGPSKVVTDVAASVAGIGGSVVDVGIVAALTAMCTEPGVCGPGGGGFLTIDLPGEEPVVIDGYMAYPGKGYTGEPRLVEVTMPYGGGVTTLVGPGSIAVPGSFAALEEASSRYGALAWGELLEAVARAVEGGFPLSAPCHTYLSEGATQIFAADPMTRDALLEAGRPRPLGSPVVFAGLAETLRTIGSEGADAFYRGDLARAIIDDLSARGGQLTAVDLDEYSVEVRQPVDVPLEGWTVALNPPPAVGGLTVSHTIGSMSDRSDLSLARALIVAFEERRGVGTRAPSTISVAAADESGGAVAGSFSAGYVSGVVPAGTGLLMNNALGELELLGAEPIPGTRMVSNMAPSVARKGKDVVALGSPGAERITTALATTLIRIGAGDGLEEAVLHPRSHPEDTNDGTRLAVEPGARVDGIGVPIRRYEETHMYFGGVNAAGVIGGELVAFADPRRTGSVAYAGR